MNNKILLSESDLVKLVREATESTLNTLKGVYNSGELYHFTTFKSAYIILKENVMTLTSGDAGIEGELIDDFHTFASFTRNGSIQNSCFPQQRVKYYKDKINVRITFNKEKLGQYENGKYKDVNFKLEKAKKIIDAIEKKHAKGNQFISQIEIFQKMGFEFPDNFDTLTDKEIQTLKNRLYNFANNWDEEETRYLSKESTMIKNISQYIDRVDILVDKKYSGSNTGEKMARLILQLPNYKQSWKGKIKFFTDAHYMDNFINEILPEELARGENEKLTQDDIDFIKKIEQTKITDSGMDYITKILYLVCSSNDNTSKIKSKIKTVLINHSLKITVVIPDSNNKEDGERKVDFIDDILSRVDDVKDMFGTTNDMTSFFQIGNRAFIKLKETLRNARLVAAQISDIYISWLNKYFEAINKASSELEHDFNSTMSRNGISKQKLISFAKKYTYIFYKIFQEKLNRPTYQKFRDSASKHLSEGRLPSINIDFSTSAGFVNSIMVLMKTMNFDEIKKKVINEYKQNVYRYDELIYFKRSVLKYRNAQISAIKTKRANFGDLAAIYNNAELANQQLDA